VYSLFGQKKMGALTLYTYANNPRALKALIVAKYCSVDVELKEIEMGKDNTSAEFLAKFPLGKVPALDTPEGPLFESNAISHYIATCNGKFAGQTAFEQAAVQQYINFADNEIAPAAATWIFPILGYVPYNKLNTTRAIEDIKKALTALNNILSTRTYLVGESVTLADIHVAVALIHLYQLVLDPEFRTPFGHVTRWFTTVVNQPHVAEVLGEIKLTQKMAQYDAKAK